MWTNTISLKQSQNASSSIILFFNRNFSGDDYFFNRIYFDNENDIVKSLKFLKRFLTLEGISGYLYIKNEEEERTSSFLRKQLKKSGFICVDSIYTLESPPPPPSLPPPIQAITTTTINLEKKISVTKIVDDPILLNTWTRIFCQSFNIKDQEPFIEIVNKNKQRFVFLLARIRNNKEHEEKNNNSSYNTDNDDNIPAGVCLLFEKYGCLGLYCLGTLPRFRNRGIAQTILKASIQIAHTMKYDKIFLQTFQNDNYIDFYKKLKFKVIYKRKIFQIN
ncbi:MAG TPA: GNAT family N-acetyltransferase [Nitrososphaeraceae archaeon]|nr:GNAT family N-acetyltransferase [Nitrososphaeraceae archaeon]